MTATERSEILVILQTRHRRAKTISERQFAAGKLDGFLLACQMFDGDTERLRNMRETELMFQRKAQ